MPLHGVCRRSHDIFVISLAFNNFPGRPRMSRVTSLLFQNSITEKRNVGGKNQTSFWRGGNHFLAFSIASPFPAQPPHMCGVHMDEVDGYICSF